MENSFENRFPIGTRVRLIEFYVEEEGTDDNLTIPPGTEGEIISQDSTSVRVKWDNGRNLGFLPDKDKIEII